VLAVITHLRATHGISPPSSYRYQGRYQSDDPREREISADRAVVNQLMPDQR